MIISEVLWLVFDSHKEEFKCESLSFCQLRYNPITKIYSLITCSKQIIDTSENAAHNYFKEGTSKTWTMENVGNSWIRKKDCKKRLVSKPFEKIVIEAF